MDWMTMALRRYVDFEGRSQRKEYWMFQLFQVLVYLVCVAIMLAGVPWNDMDNPNSQPGPLLWVGIGLAGLFWLGTLLPSIAVTVRRFHDQDQTGWLYPLYFIPYIGGIVVFVFMCLDGTAGDNKFGPDPKGRGAMDVFS